MSCLACMIATCESSPAFLVNRVVSVHVSGTWKFNSKDVSQSSVLELLLQVCLSCEQTNRL